MGRGVVWGVEPVLWRRAGRLWGPVVARGCPAGGRRIHATDLCLGAPGVAGSCRLPSFQGGPLCTGGGLERALTSTRRA